MSDARFRFRDASGTEHSLASVEELSSRVEAGEVKPDTELFDAGAGGWSRAGDLPIFQFIVDELRMEGRLPEAFERVDPPPPPVSPPATPEGKARSADPSTPSEYDFHIDGVEDEGDDEGEGDRDPVGDEAQSGSGPAPTGSDKAPTGRDEDRSRDRSPPADPAEEAGEELASDVEEEPRPPHEELPLTPDPFEMHLPRTSASNRDDEAPSEETGNPADAGPSDRDADASPPRKPGSPRDADDIPLHEWLRHTKGEDPDDPAGEAEKTDDLKGRKGFGTRAHDDDRPRRLRDLQPLAGSAPPPGGGPRPSPGGETTGGGGMVPEDPPSPAEDPETPGEIRSRPPPPRKDGRGRNFLRQRDRRRSMVVALLLGGGLIIGVAIFAVTAGDSDPPTSAPPGSSPSGPPAVEAVIDLPAHPLPVEDSDEAAALLGVEGEEMAERMQLLVMEALDGLIDSVRVEHELAAVPPPGWLGGSYLSTASDFNEVLEFWDGYDGFIRHLMEADEVLHLEAARRAWLDLPGHEWPDDPDVISDPRLDAFLEEVVERYTLVEPIRQARYEGRLGVAAAARELHDFLMEHEDRIEYAPALGRGISRDPILEAVPGDEVTRRELDRQLDRLFIALDQTRQGVPPALGGLRTELFNRLREPV